MDDVGSKASGKLKKVIKMNEDDVKKEPVQEEKPEEPDIPEKEPEKPEAPEEGTEKPDTPEEEPGKTETPAEKEDTGTSYSTGKEPEKESPGQKEEMPDKAEDIKEEGKGNDKEDIGDSSQGLFLPYDTYAGETVGTETVLVDNSELLDYIAATDTCLSFGLFFSIGLLLARITWGRLR